MTAPFQAFRVFNTKWEQGQYIVSFFPTPTCSDEELKMESETLRAQQISFIEAALREKLERESK